MLNSKSETRNPKQIRINKTQNPKPFDLEERTCVFTQSVIVYINALPKRVANLEIAKQLMRSSGSIGANYIEANEALSKKDFVMHTKIARKEAKEICYWLRLTDSNVEYVKHKETLIQESTELMKIFGAIFRKSG